MIKSLKEFFTLNRLSRMAVVVLVTICILLSVLLIVMASEYMVMMVGADNNALPENVLYELRSGGGESPVFELGKIIPDFAGFRVADVGGFVGVSRPGIAVYSFYYALQNQLSAVFGAEGSCQLLDEEAGRQLWERCVAGENFVYIDFGADLPEYYIRAFSGGDYESDTRAGEYGRVCELFLIYDRAEDGGFSMRAVSRSHDGAVRSYMTQKTFTLEDVISFYRNPDFMPCSFAGDQNAALPLSSTSVIYEYDISCENIVPCETELGVIPDRLLNSLGYNPDKLNSYLEAGGSRVYVESHGTLRCRKNSIEYSASQSGGIPLSELLGYADYSGWNIFDYLLACCAFTDRANEYFDHAFGGECSVKLGSISRDGNAVTMDFDYYYDNIPILRSGCPVRAFSFTLLDGRVTALHAEALRLNGDDTYTSAYPQMWALDRIASSAGEDIMDREGQNEGGRLFIAYDLDNSADDKIGVCWIYGSGSAEVSDEME